MKKSSIIASVVFTNLLAFLETLVNAAGRGELNATYVQWLRTLADKIENKINEPKPRIQLPIINDDPLSII